MTRQSMVLGNAIAKLSSLAHYGNMAQVNELYNMRPLFSQGLLD